MVSRKFTVGLALAATSVISAIGLQAQSRPKTFARDVAPIVYQNCVSCHRPGEAAPFSLLTYDDVKQRARLIAEVTQNHYMPPWQPDSEAGEFEGDRRLSPAQIDVVQEWVEQGAQEGDPRELPHLPAAGTSGWRLGKPDIVVTMEQPFSVVAEGRDVFRNFVLPVPLGERKYVKALEFRPGNARVLHHARILLDESGDIRRLDAQDGEPGFAGMDVAGAHFPDGHFLGWAPGKMPDTETYQWPIEPGTDLVVQMHLKPTGQPETVQASIGLYLTDTPPSATPVMIRLGSKTIDMQAGEARHEVTDSYVLPTDVTIISVYPHAHYLGREMTVTAKKPDGGVETLLHIPNWNFNWQDAYTFRRPVPFKKGTTLQMRYFYDNSAANPRNPNHPPRRVRFGSETSDEMGELLVQVLPKRASDIGTIRSDVIRKNLNMDIAGEEKRLRDRPDDYENRNSLGVDYMKAGRQTEALRLFQETLRQAPAYPLVHYNLAVIAMMERRFDAAAASFERALELRPDYAEAANNLGALRETLRQPELALEQYRRALAARPTHAAAHANLGRLLLSQGQTAEAMVHLQQAVHSRPDNPDALYYLGRVHLAQERPRETVQLWRKAIGLRPENARWLVELSTLLLSEFKVQDVGQAVSLAEQANKATGGNNPSVLALLASAYAEDGRMPLALRTNERAVNRALAAGEEELAIELRGRAEQWQQQQSVGGGAENP